VFGNCETEKYVKLLNNTVRLKGTCVQGRTVSSSWWKWMFQLNPLLHHSNPLYPDIIRPLNLHVHYTQYFNTGIAGTSHFAIFHHVRSESVKMSHIFTQTIDLVWRRICGVCKVWRLWSVFWIQQ